MIIRFISDEIEVLQLRVRNSCVEGRIVKCFNAIAGGEGPRLYVLLTDL
jgi:hypothetical protein